MDYFDALNNVESHDWLFAIVWPERLGQRPSWLSSEHGGTTRLFLEDSFWALLLLSPVRSNFTPSPFVITVVVVTVSHHKGARVRMQSEALAQPFVYYLLL